MTAAIEKILSRVTKRKARGVRLGLDAGNRSVKALSARFAKGLEIDHWFEVLRGSEPLMPAIRTKVADLKIERALTAYSLADEQLESHSFRLPKLPLKELDTAIEWEIKKTVPSPAAVFHDVLKTETAQGFEVTCWIGSREIIKNRHEEAVTCALKPESLEAESSALASLCRWLYPDQPLSRWAIVDLGHVAYRIIFVQQGQVAFTRSLYFGISTLETQIAGDVGIAPEEIDRELRDGIKADRQPLVERHMQESLYNLCEEFRRSEYFAREQKGLEEVETIGLCGGGACWPAAVEYLKRHLSEKRVEIIDPFARAMALPPGLKREQGPQWACAAGLAMREAEA